MADCGGFADVLDSYICKFALIIYKLIINSEGRCVIINVYTLKYGSVLCDASAGRAADSGAP